MLLLPPLLRLCRQLNIEKMAQLRDTLKRFEQRLLLDKKFLVPFIRTLETQSKFHMTDR